MKVSLSSFIILLIIIKSFLWMFAIPIFQSPDEVTHFSYIQRLAEVNSFINQRSGGITSLELMKATKILNFNWGKKHPVWQGYQTDWWEKLKQIPFADRKQFIHIEEQRGLKNPPLYYFLSSFFYKFSYPASFVYRFFALRTFSVIFSLLTVFMIYKIGFLIFADKLVAGSIASLVAFQPMFSFLTVSINNDILAIFSGTLFIYLGINSSIFFAFLVILVGLFIKPQLILFLFAFPLLLGKKFSKGILVSLLTVFFILLTGYVLFDLIKIRGEPVNFSDSIRYQIAFNPYKEHFFFFLSQLKNGTLFRQIVQYFSQNRETYLENLFPWYWGVFGWLEATMPLLVYRVLKIICALSIFGLILWFVRNFKKEKKNKTFPVVIFLIWTSIVFSLGIIFNDFKVFVDRGVAFGIQGRYFLPVIAAQMSLLLLGLKTLVPKRLKKTLFILLITGSIVLNAIGFWTMYSYFYG